MKPIQIVYSVVFLPAEGDLENRILTDFIVLCDDGTIWLTDGNYPKVGDWEQVKGPWSEVKKPKSK